MRFKLEIYCDTEVDAATPHAAWEDIKGRVQEIVTREYADQMAGREEDAETDGLLYGLSLRLPGSMIVTGLDLRPGYDEDDPGYDRPPDLPVLKLIKGGG